MSWASSVTQRRFRRLARPGSECRVWAAAARTVTDIVLYLGAGGTAFSLDAALRRLRAWHSDVPGAVSDADDWVGQPEGGVRVKPTERRLGRLELARDGTARGSVFLGTDG